MATFTLTINTDNAAFWEDAPLEDPNGAVFGFSHDELARTLESAQKQVICGITTGTLRDTNGNTVGRFELTPDVREVGTIQDLTKQGWND